MTKTNDFIERLNVAWSEAIANCTFDELIHFAEDVNTWVLIANTWEEKPLTIINGNGEIVS